MFFILRLSFIFYTVHAVPVFKQGECISSFQVSAKEQIEVEIRSLGVERFIEKYKEQKGYVELSKKLTAQMHYVYQLISKFLEPEQKNSLKWQHFQGKAEEFFELRGNILNDKGEVRKEYIEMKGYAVFADKYYHRRYDKDFYQCICCIRKKRNESAGMAKFSRNNKGIF